MKNLALTILNLILFLTVTGQEVYILPSKTQLKQDVKQLSSPQFYGRYPGHESFEKVVDFVESRFQESGLEPYTDTNYRQYFETYECKSITKGFFIGDKWVNASESIFPHRKHYMDSAQVYEVVFCGDGSKPYIEGKNLEGKIALMLTDNIHKGYFLKDSLTGKNAAGIIASTIDGKEVFKSAYRTSVSIEKLRNIYNEYPDTTDHFLHLSAGKSYVEKIMGCKFKVLQEVVRKNDTASSIRGALGVYLSAEFDTVRSPNIVGVLPGKAGNKDYLLIMAHYDHLKPINNSIIFPGADDNASGVASLFAVANFFKENNIEPQCSLVFMATSLEESGLYGSEYYYNNPIFPLENIKAVINLDMVGRSDTKHRNNYNYIYAFGTDCSPNLHQCVLNAETEVPHFIVDFSENNSTKNSYSKFWSSDHRPFGKNNIPFVFFISGLHSDYHKPSDTYEKLNYKGLQKRATMFSHVLLETSNYEGNFSRTDE